MMHSAGAYVQCLTSGPTEHVEEPGMILELGASSVYYTLLQCPIYL